MLDNILFDLAPNCIDKWLGFLLIGTNCAPLVADLFLFCYERDFKTSLSDDKQADGIDAFNTASRYLNVINNVYFDKYG